MGQLEDMLSQMFGGDQFKAFGKIKPEELTRLMMINMLRNMQEQIEEVIRKLQTGEADPYTILGTRRSASEEEVKHAYRARARKAHPDRGGSNDQMSMINLAYDRVRKERGWK